MSDFIDKLTHSEPETEREVGTVNKIGVRRVNVMAVPTRAISIEDIEDREATYHSLPEFPLPFWDLDDGGVLEPLLTNDYATLKSAGITPEEWEIAVLEDHMERQK